MVAIAMMQNLASEAAIALENARLYDDMKQEVDARRRVEKDLRAALAEVESLKNRLQAKNVYRQQEIQGTHNLVEIIGDSPALLAVLSKIEQVATTDATVLIFGETGTAKELVARAITVGALARIVPSSRSTAAPASWNASSSGT